MATGGADTSFQPRPVRANKSGYKGPGLPCHPLSPTGMAVLTFFVLGPALFGLSEGCFRPSRAPASPTARPMIIVVPDDTDMMTPDEPSRHETRLPCNEYEDFKTSCLNGGVCVAMEDYTGYRRAACHCREEFWGPRCEEYKPLFEILGVRQRRILTAKIAAGVTCCIVVIFVILFIVFVSLRYHKRRKLMRRKHKKHAENGGNKEAEHLMNNGARTGEKPSFGSTVNTVTVMDL